MAKKDLRIDAYIDKAAPFAKPILKHLRKIVHAGCPNAEETLKWSMPHFDYKGIMCGMAAFKSHCAFGFWKRKLIFEGGKTKINEAMGHFGPIKSLDDLPNEKTLIGLVRKAAELNERGIKLPPRPRSTKKKSLTVPKDLRTALSKNKKAQKTFDEFSYSNKKDYVEWITEAKRDETRRRRLATAVTWMSQGKARNWKYC